LGINVGDECVDRLQELSIAVLLVTDVNGDFVEPDEELVRFA